MCVCPTDYDLILNIARDNVETMGECYHIAVVICATGGESCFSVSDDEKGKSNTINDKAWTEVGYV